MAVHCSGTLSLPRCRDSKPHAQSLTHLTSPFETPLSWASCFLSFGLSQIWPLSFCELHLRPQPMGDACLGSAWPGCPGDMEPSLTLAAAHSCIASTAAHYNLRHLCQDLFRTHQRKCLCIRYTAHPAGQVCRHPGWRVVISMRWRVVISMSPPVPMSGSCCLHSLVPHYSASAVP